MCGRVYQALGVGQLLRLAGTNVMRNQNRHQASHNIAPSTYIPAIRHTASAENNHRELDMMKWGYNSPFGQLLINARVEDCETKKTFKDLVNTSRCVVIIEGYFEWTPNHEPYVFRPKENKGSDKPPVLYIASLIAPDETLILLTRQALREFVHVHERMPVILDESEIDMWLDCENYKWNDIIDKEILNEKKEKWDTVFHYQIGPHVNNLKTKTDKVIYTLEEYKKDLDKNGIKKFFQSSKKKEEKKEEEKKEAESVAQTTQATEATDDGDKMIDETQKKTDEQIAEELAQKASLGEDDKEKFKDPAKIKRVQKAVDQAGLVGNAGFKVANAFVLTNRDKPAGSDEKNSLKRKEPISGGKLVNQNAKQMKKAKS